jgi:hypothetical protein
VLKLSFNLEGPIHPPAPRLSKLDSSTMLR